MFSRLNNGGRWTALAAALLVASCGGGSDAPEETDTAGAEDLQAARVQPQVETEGTRFIVKFKDIADLPGARGRDIAAAHGGRLQHQYEHVLKGFTITVPPAAAEAFLQAMQRNPLVEVVEPDAVATHSQLVQSNATWGLAKGASVVPVRVLGCDGTGYVSGIIAGLDWIVAQGVRPAVANISIGASASSTLDAAVARAVANNITVAVAAGNSNADACTASPAREPSALTVGATANNDARASYSNWGTCLDIFAPGSNITSASSASDAGTALMTGTSMATPHVAGLAAVYPGSTRPWNSRWLARRPVSRMYARTPLPMAL